MSIEPSARTAKRSYTVTLPDGREVWKYGNAWERFPVQDRCVYAVGLHRFRVGSIMDADTLAWACKQSADFAYVDPPWNQGNLSTFYTKSGMRGGAPRFNAFIDGLLQSLKSVKYDAFIEMGVQHIADLSAIVTQAGGSVVREYPTTYYGKHPARLLHVFWHQTLLDLQGQLEGQDDEQTPDVVCRALPKGSVVMDVCMGRGGTARAAIRNGCVARGTELNPRRLAHAIESAHLLTKQPMRKIE